MSKDLPLFSFAARNAKSANPDPPTPKTSAGEPRASESTESLAKVDRPSPASDPRVSAWVSANAGAGKTHLLADRVTRLLLDGAHPSRILCLTYTKAAAAEMSSRLFDRLGAWALLSDAELRARLNEIGAGSADAAALARARRLFAQALETPGGLKIQTIHAFCQHILTRFPLEADVPARFNVLDERSAAELMQSARIAVLERAGADAALSARLNVLATRAGDLRFAEMIEVAILAAGKLKDMVARHGGQDGFFDHLRSVLGLAEGETELSVVTQFCSQLGGERKTCERIVQWLLAGRSGDQSRGRDLQRFIEGGFGAKVFGELQRFFLTSNGPRVTLATKGLAASEPALHAFLQQWQDRLLAMEERRKSAATFELTEALIGVALAVLETYEKAKRARAALDYDDLIRATLALLEQDEAASWVLYKLDGGLDHILVDEAQDTSPEQWRIVAKLAEEFTAGEGIRTGEKPRTVFAVGDEKQSIFSFQGAAPEEFRRNLALFRARAEAARHEFVEDMPAVSRRGAKSILRFVDEVFAPEDARDGLSFTGAGVAHAPYRNATGRVELWPTVKAPPKTERDPYLPVDAPSPTDAPVVLAAKIAERIASWLNEGATLPGTDKPISAGGIMILVRRRNAFSEEMIRQLTQRGVAVAGADRMILLDQIAIADLLALGRFALLPQDDLNLAALLKSPMIGFDEDALFSLAYPRERRHLWEELLGRKDENALFTAAHEFLSRMLAQADFRPPFEFFAEALARGMRRKIEARLGPEAEDAIDEFLALALAHEGMHAPSLESFLDWFQRGANEVKRDMEQGGGAVRVMTVHGAKGLEADVVIVPDTAQVPDHDRKAALLYSEDCVFYGVPKALETAPLSAAKNAARLREMREYRRLLYVALTRAREWLILCGYETRNGVHGESWYPHLDRAAHAIGAPETDASGETVLVVGAPPGAPAATEGAIPSRVSLPAFLSQAPAESSAERFLRPSDAADDGPVISPTLDGGERFRRGLLVHALLAALPDLPQAERKEAGLRYLARRAIAAPEAEALLRETLTVLDHADFAPLFAEGSRAEVSVIADLPELGAGTRIGGQIDRLAVTKDEVLIADFKTNRPPPKTVDDTSSLYRVQMALYREALRKIYPDRVVRCALVWTDGARLMPLPDSLLDAELDKIRARQAAEIPA
jgi:ATP-dependent helicase/nuclease subunit A